MNIGTIFLSIPLVGMEDLEAFHEFAELVEASFFAVNSCVRPKGTSEQVYEQLGSFLDGLAFLYYIGLFLFSREEMKE